MLDLIKAHSISETFFLFGFKEQTTKECENRLLKYMFDLVRYYLKNDKKLNFISDIDDRFVAELLMQNLTFTLSVAQKKEITKENTFYEDLKNEDLELIFLENQMPLDIRRIKPLLDTPIESSSQVNFSEKTIKVCLSNQVNSIYDLLHIYLLRESFFSKNGKIQKEITPIVESYLHNLDKTDVIIIQTFPSKNEVLQSIIEQDGLKVNIPLTISTKFSTLRETTLYDFFKKGIIQQRTYNTCSKAGLQNLYDITKLYIKEESFVNITGKNVIARMELLGLINATINSLSELEKGILQDKISLSYPSQMEKENTASLCSIINNTNQHIENIYHQVVSNQSTRTRNLLKNVGIDDFIANFLYLSNKDILKMHNVGPLTAREIISVQNIVKKHLKNEQGNKSHQISYNETCQFILFPDFTQYKFIQVYLTTNKHLPMLWIAEHILLNTGDFRNIDTFFTYAYDSLTTIFFNALKKHGLKKKDFSIYNIRVHKNLSNTDYLELLKNEANQFPFDNRFKIQMLWNYITDKIRKNPVIKVDKHFLQNDCKNEECEMNPIFMFCLVMKWQCPDYIPFSYPVDSNSSNTNESIDSLYFVKKSILDKFDLMGFLKIFQSFYNLEGYQNRIDLHELINISSFWKTEKPSCKEDLFKIVTTIIKNELGIIYEDQVFSI